jgi:hypothetical protein
MVVPASKHTQQPIVNQKTETMSSKKESTDVQVVETETLAVAPTNNSLAFSTQDIDIPRLNVIQKMSEIKGPIGAVVIDQDSVLLEAEQKAPVIVIGAVKKWKENVPFGEDYIPKIVSSEAEAKDIASDSNYEVIEFAEIVLLIPQTGDDDSLFPYPIGDTNYQIGRITVQKDAYRLTYKRLFTFQTFNPAISVATRFWNFGTELMSKGKYSWYVPTLAITKNEAPADAIEFANRLTKGSN